MLMHPILKCMRRVQKNEEVIWPCLFQRLYAWDSAASSSNKLKRLLKLEGAQHVQNLRSCCWFLTTYKIQVQMASVESQLSVRSIFTIWVDRSLDNPGMHLQYACSAPADSESWTAILDETRTPSLLANILNSEIITTLIFEILKYPALICSKHNTTSLPSSCLSFSSLVACFYFIPHGSHKNKKKNQVQLEEIQKHQRCCHSNRAIPSDNQGSSKAWTSGCLV